MSARPLLLVLLLLSASAHAAPPRGEAEARVSARKQNHNSPALDTSALRKRLAALEAARPAALSASVLTSIGHVLDVTERIRESFPSDAPEWHARARRYLDAAEQGQDPFVAAAELGRIVSRGYRSPISQRIQGYTLYVPKTYTPERAWPLMIVLHGGSSNGNLFLGVVLGNNMSWLEYPKHLWHRYEPRFSPDWIIAAPDGYGQVLWRWMGEQDVLDVIEDVKSNYHVDADRVVLSGLSNGGVGAYSIGSRHASEFALVQAIAGCPSWAFYAGESSVTEPEASIMRGLSAIDLAENWYNTDFRYYHGHTDPGPMRPAYVVRLDKSLEERAIPHRGKWYDAGHDLLYLVHRHGKIFDELATVERQTAPATVHVVSGDYRAARQHWLEITRFLAYPELARLQASVQGARIDVTTRNVGAFSIDLRDAPLTTEEIQVFVDGREALRGKRESVGHKLHLVAGANGFGPGLPKNEGKRPGVSGPLSDAYYGRMIHVYGTAKPDETAELKKIAEKGAKGWPLWLWTVDQEVVADRDVTPAMIRDAHLVLYGTKGANLVLERLAQQLPIRLEEGALIAGEKRFEGKGIGTRFIYPNPENPERYVIVQAAPTTDGVRRGHHLPDFVPDYVIYDAETTSARARLVPSKAPRARGFFDANWRLAP